MPRRLPVQFEGPSYHAMSRGKSRQDIVVDDQVVLLYCRAWGLSFVAKGDIGVR
jgi:hypothetical protein